MKAEALGWRPGLEGLRGVAVLAVMLYHIRAIHQWFPGGSLGVDLFLILSGFLITTLLLEERWRTGTIAFVAFYQRRAVRLLPALGFFLLACSLIAIAGKEPGTGYLPVTLAGSGLYVFNWLDDVGIETTNGFGHLWSLSVEEQFYLLWPLLLFFSLRWGSRALLLVSLAVFVISASLPFWTGRPYGDLYSGTDFRAQQLMAGAILAQLRFSGVVTPAIVSRWSFRVLFGLAVAFFAVTIVSLEDRAAFVTDGFYTVAGVLGAVIVCGVVYAPPRLLTNRAIMYVGSRSYALYLWHHPIAFWLRDMYAIPEIVVTFGLSFLAAEISWQLVERRGSPLRTLPGAVKGVWHRRGQGGQAARPGIALGTSEPDAVT